jgi:hypothetical protein
MHVGWRLCPVAWQGQYKGAKGKPTIILEAFCDHFLWLWHTSFSLPGTLNDINVWDQSPLLKQFIDGTFSFNVDFEYEIAGEFFNQVFILVDGIYPELSRFVKTISEPIEKKGKLYAKWQEKTRKDIERAFGVLQRKFHILVKALEFWYLEDIKNIVNCCITLHNMMVETRVERDELEGQHWYEMVNVVDNDGVAQDPAEAYVERQRAELDLHRRLQEAFYDGPAVVLHERSAIVSQRLRALENLRQEAVNRRWDCLQSKDEHFRLRQAIMVELLRRSKDKET